MYSRKVSPIVFLFTCISVPISTNADHSAGSSINLRGKRKQRNLVLPNDPRANCAIYPCDTYYCPENLRPLWCDSASNEDTDPGNESNDGVRVAEPEVESTTAPPPGPSAEESDKSDPCDLTELGYEFYKKKAPPQETLELDEDVLVVAAKSGSDSTGKSNDVAKFATFCLADSTCPGFFTDAKLKDVVHQAMIDATEVYTGECHGLYVRKSVD